MKNLEERLNEGSFGNDAIVGGRMRCLPGFSGVSMVRPFTDCVRDLWVLIEGKNMLNLSFNAILDCLKQMRKSAKHWVHHLSTPGKPRFNIEIRNKPFNLGSEDNKNALCALSAVEEILDFMMDDFARLCTKKQIVEQLVCVSEFKFVIFITFSGYP